MPQDAFTLRFIAGELNKTFTGGKISKINQPSKDVLSLLIYTQKGTLKLNCDLSAKYCRISAGESLEWENPKVAPNFCMLLRKHLQNAEILQVAQAGFERVIYFDFKCFSEFEITQLRLYVEVMGKYSNAVLTKDGLILGALKTASLETGARRITLSGAKYLLPAKQDKADPTDLSALEPLFPAQTDDVAKYISERVAGLAYVTAMDIEKHYGNCVTTRQIYDYVNDGNCSPCVEETDGIVTDFKARNANGAKAFETLLEAQAYFYDRAVSGRRFADAKRRLQSCIAAAEKKVEKRLAVIYDKLRECEKSELIKLKGELITANIYAVERGASCFEAVNYYDENQGKISIELDPRLTPSQNAQRYYKRYQKLKRTEQNLSAQKLENEQRSEYLKSISANLNLAENMQDFAETEEELIAIGLLPAPKATGKKAKAKAETPYRRYEYKGFTVLCGRNNVQNDRLTKGLAPADIWLHAKTFHSSHVGIVTEGKQPPDGVIKFAAEICAYYSAAREKDKVSIDFTQKKYVKKPNGANAGFAVYTDFSTILVTPDPHKKNSVNEE